jgi:two-component system chemotaxis sensor kinase CheA
VSITDHVRAELLGEFRQSARDRLERIGSTWLAIEADPAGAGAHAPLLLRELHTLKGEAKLMGFGEVCALAHRAEDVVLAARARHFAANAAISELLLRAIDALARLIELDATTTCDPSLSAALDAATSSSSSPSPSGPLPLPVPLPLPSLRSPSPSPSPSPDRDGFVRIDVAAAHVLAEGAGEQLIAHQRYLRLAAELRTVGETLGSDVLDSLLDRLDDELHRGDVVARALELDARRLRLVPLAPRLRLHLRAVRDLAHELGKKAALRIHDGGIAVDRDVVERLGEPLLHLLRNAVDHGLESPAARAAAGKPEIGTIHITAERAGGDVVIVVEDDGAGVDPEAVRRRAAELGLVADPLALDDDAAFALLFSPGFSTRRRVTETSGRGVGLDVVKRQVEGLGGSVRLSSRPCHGTRFELRIPVSVALTRALAVVEQGQAFVFPHAAVEAVVTAEHAAIELVHTRRTLALRDGRVPVVDLSSILRLPPTPATTEDVHAVVLRHEGQRVAVVVDSWRGDAEVVVKPLGALAPSRLAIGACTLDGGELAVVLSPAEVIARALGEVPRIRAAARAPQPAAARRILVVEDSAITRTMISRLLRMLGYQVAEAGDGSHALRVLDDGAADLVITDIEMPELDGIGLLQRLRADDRWRTTPVIVLTTRGSEHDKRRAVAAGADAYLVKTEFSEAALRDALVRHLGAS